MTMNGDIEIRIKDLSAAEIESFQDFMKENGAYDIQMFESPARISAYMESKYSDDAYNILNSDNVISGRVDLLDHESGAFRVVKDKAGVREEDAVFLSDLKTSELLAELKLRGLDLDDKKVNKLLKNVKESREW